MKLYIPVGIPGSGKSFWIRGKGVVIVSPDAWRIHVYGGYPSKLDKEREKEVWHLAYQQLSLTLDDYRSVGFDACNITAERRQEVLRYAPPGCTTVAVYFPTPVDVCIDRQNGRRNPISIDIIENMQARLEEPMEDEGFNLIMQINYEDQQHIHTV